MEKNEKWDKAKLEAALDGVKPSDLEDKIGQVLLDMGEDGLKKLDSELKFHLIYLLTTDQSRTDKLVFKDKLGFEGRACLARIYRNLPILEEFTAYNKKALDWITSEVGLDKDLRRGFKAWKGADNKKRLELLERLGEIQCEVYGYDMPDLKLVDEPYKNGYGFLGMYRTDMGEDKKADILINIHSERDWGNLAGVLKTFTHEMAHHMQYRLVHLVFEGKKLDREHPCYMQSMFFRLNILPSAYFEGRDVHNAYLFQPMERHANEQGAAMAKSIRPLLVDGFARHLERFKGQNFENKALPKGFPLPFSGKHAFKKKAGARHESKPSI